MPSIVGKRCLFFFVYNYLIVCCIRLWSDAKTRSRTDLNEPRISSTAEPSRSFCRPSRQKNALSTLNIVLNHAASSTQLPTGAGTPTFGVASSTI